MVELRVRDLQRPTSLTCATKDELWSKVRARSYTLFYRAMALYELESRGVELSVVNDVLSSLIDEAIDFREETT